MGDDTYLTGANWRHRRSGETYCIEGFVTREDDLETMVVYRKSMMHGSTDPIWIRPAREFFDGRYVRMFPGLNIEEPRHDPR